MKFHTLLAVYLLINCGKSEPFYRLVWSDEFDGNNLDLNKWDIENEWARGVCRGDYIGEENCNTNRTENLQLREGALAIVATREPHTQYGKPYTSGKIITKNSWTYGRFEIRAALPRGKMLRSALTLVPYRPEYWAIGGAVYVLTNGQTQALGVGVHFGDPPEFVPQGYEYTTGADLHQYHTYAVEWTDRKINWFFDDINHYSLSIAGRLAPIYAKPGQPFDRAFKLEVHLGVGGDLFPGQRLLANESAHWQCPAFLVDYVRVYKRVYYDTQQFPIPVPDGTDLRANIDGICAAITRPGMSSGGAMGGESTPAPEPNGHSFWQLIELKVLLALVWVLSGLIVAVLVCACVKRRKKASRPEGLDHNLNNVCNDNEPQFYTEIRTKTDDLYYA